MHIMSIMNSLFPSPYEYCIQGLVVDSMEDGKAMEWIGQALDLITGLRPKDLIYEYMIAGKVFDSMFLCKIFYLDHLVNVTAAEIIQTLVQYRAHSSQKCSIMECLISQKCYQGPVFNETVGKAKLVSNERVRKILSDLFIINNAAIDILRNF